MMEAQGGFRQDRRCADQVFVLRNVVEFRKKEKAANIFSLLGCEESIRFGLEGRVVAKDEEVWD